MPAAPHVDAGQFKTATVYTIRLIPQSRPYNPGARQSLGTTVLSRESQPVRRLAKRNYPCSRRHPASRGSTGSRRAANLIIRAAVNGDNRQTCEATGGPATASSLYGPCRSC